MKIIILTCKSDTAYKNSVYTRSLLVCRTLCDWNGVAMHYFTIDNSSIPFNATYMEAYADDKKFDLKFLFGRLDNLTLHQNKDIHCLTT